LTLKKCGDEGEIYN